MGRVGDNDGQKRRRRIIIKWDNLAVQRSFLRRVFAPDQEPACSAQGDFAPVIADRLFAAYRSGAVEHIGEANRRETVLYRNQGEDIIAQRRQSDSSVSHSCLRLGLFLSHANKRQTGHPPSRSTSAGLTVPVIDGPSAPASV